MLFCYKRLTLNPGNKYNERERMGKRHSMQIVTTRVGETMLTSDKKDFKSNTVKNK